MALLELPGARIRERASPSRSGLALPHLSRVPAGSRAGIQEAAISSARGPPREFSRWCPEDASFALAARKLSTPQIVDARALPLFDADAGMETLEPEAAIERIEELRGRGASHVAFMRETFSWLADRPLLEEHLSKTCRSVLENEHVRVLELGSGLEAG